MLLTDSLIVIGLATASLGTIQEADGIQEHSFMLLNSGTDTVAITQGYTSCGCTTVEFCKNVAIAPGDSTRAVLRFNPQGRGGEFFQSGTLVYGNSHKRIEIALEGNCVTSEETLMRQFPIAISDSLRLSANHFDLGRMRVGETKERGVMVLHTANGNRKERIPITFTVTADMPLGLQHIVRPIAIRDGEQTLTVNIVLDVMVK